MAKESKLYVSPIASPMADKKLSKTCFKLIKKATKTKRMRRGVKEVVKALRKGEKGVCFIAANIFPVDVVAHIPIMCEDNEVPYVFVPSKEELGSSAATKRPTSVILVRPGDASLQKYYDAAHKDVSAVKPIY